MNDNRPPRHVFDALKRVYACNQTQLAERLAISTRTLRRYERGEAPDREIARAREMLRRALADVPAPRRESPEDA